LFLPKMSQTSFWKPKLPPIEVTSDPCESVQICGDFPTKRKPGWLARLLQRRVEMWLHHSAARADAGFARRVSQELLSNIGEYEGNIAWISATQWPGQHLAIT
jgi:hypothetical protein